MKFLPSFDNLDQNHGRGALKEPLFVFHRSHTEEVEARPEKELQNSKKKKNQKKRQKKNTSKLRSVFAPIESKYSTVSTCPLLQATGSEVRVVP